MERYFRRAPNEEMRNLRASRVLELNAGHPAVQALKAAFDGGEREKAANYAKILDTMAELMAGCEIEDPANFVSLVSELLK